MASCRWKFLVVVATSKSSAGLCENFAGQAYYYIMKNYIYMEPPWRATNISIQVYAYLAFTAYNNTTETASGFLGFEKLTPNIKEHLKY